jgi:hypothetical protein
MKCFPKRGYIAIHKRPLVQQCKVEARLSQQGENDHERQFSMFLYAGEYESVEDAKVDLQELQEPEP